MLLLSLFWFVLGIVLGGIASIAQLCPSLWKRGGWLYLMGISAVSATGAGWIGVLLFGRYFATPTALWIPISIIVVLWMVTKVRAKKAEL